MPLNSLKAVIARLRRSRAARKQFVESHLAKTIAYQIRATRDRLGWSQQQLAGEVGMNQNAISRLESPEYGKPTLTTLKRLASALDVALVVRFVPFSELVDWVTTTPRTISGLSTESLAVADFDAEERMGVFDAMVEQSARLHQLTTFDFATGALYQNATLGEAYTAAPDFPQPHLVVVKPIFGSADVMRKQAGSQGRYQIVQGTAVGEVSNG
jgi:transcriptional regulator with XRE-family HTH domain